MSKFIDAEQFAEDELEAYMRAQMELIEMDSDRTEATRLVNQLVHMKMQMLIAGVPAADVVSREQYNAVYEENIRLRAELEKMTK